MRRVLIDAPAKVNLGLEVLGRRADGYHDIRSVMAMLELSDRLVVFEDERESNDEVAGVAGPENLIRKALTRYRDAVPASSPLGWRIEKRIPAAAGLGGASSDAAATLIAANVLAGDAIHAQELQLLASELGSDVPFFLGTPVGIASGRGTEVEPLPPIAGKVILIVPDVSLEAKTQSMYGALKPQDFGDGTTTRIVVESLGSGRLPSCDELRNSFSRAAGERLPQLQALWEQLDLANIGSFALTGAGPTTFVLVDHEQVSSEVARSLRDTLPSELRIIETAFRSTPLAAQLEHVDRYD
jgi:4-diphosphocytidyl-2-C-methyl-D-erythritol kinase